MNQQRMSYPSDISEEKWEKISPLVSFENRRGRNRSTDLREIVNSINYRWNTKCVWRMLPHDFPPWETIYYYFKRWKNSGKLIDIREIMITRESSNNSQSHIYRKNVSEPVSTRLSAVQTNAAQASAGLASVTVRKVSSWNPSRFENNFTTESSRSA